MVLRFSVLGLVGVLLAEGALQTPSPAPLEVGEVLDSLGWTKDTRGKFGLDEAEGMSGIDIYVGSCDWDRERAPDISAITPFRSWGSGKTRC